MTRFTGQLKTGVKLWEKPIKIRKVKDKDIQAISTICMDSFLRSVAETLPDEDEGISTFSTIAASESFLNRMTEDNLILVAEIHEEIKGIIELKEGRHIAMLFIDHEYQKKGIGRKLILSSLAHASGSTVTVSASLPSVPAYKKFGFKCRGDIGKSAGLIYQPMEIKINPPSCRLD